jgi:hypothetical protein
MSGTCARRCWLEQFDPCTSPFWKWWVQLSGDSSDTCYWDNDEPMAPQNSAIISKNNSMASNIFVPNKLPKIAWRIILLWCSMSFRLTWITSRRWRTASCQVSWLLKELIFARNLRWNEKIYAKLNNIVIHKNSKVPSFQLTCRPTPYHYHLLHSTGPAGSGELDLGEGSHQKHLMPCFSSSNPGIEDSRLGPQGHALDGAHQNSWLVCVCVQSKMSL